ncbi:hypothetical protein P153DRAFT_34758 [Dothidotthia symphoricarpi CBS 119687]|uniref:Uncharacterized protein n=1 Tax=Dothidotthia symphoricarpi CBS 119687 TaxID=1392245 RepID=A0A6A6A9S4_9PLEO|nr:uncharacterized protein P153DRAFT_34758 [Dothidotthia symphoricarpi CBS 119687]KAF2128316.1 hypothetical protein P153DRAFT_34758 [Dothidotthia symphoricarpi CBS 119687]
MSKSASQTADCIQRPCWFLVSGFWVLETGLSKVVAALAPYDGQPFVMRMHGNREDGPLTAPYTSRTECAYLNEQCSRDPEIN